MSRPLKGFGSWRSFGRRGSTRHVHSWQVTSRLWCRPSSTHYGCAPHRAITYRRWATRFLHAPTPRGFALRGVSFLSCAPLLRQFGRRAGFRSSCFAAYLFTASLTARSGGLPLGGALSGPSPRPSGGWWFIAANSIGAQVAQTPREWHEFEWSLAHKALPSGQCRIAGSLLHTLRSGLQAGAEIVQEITDSTL